MSSPSNKPKPLEHEFGDAGAALPRKFLTGALARPLLEGCTFGRSCSSAVLASKGLAEGVDVAAATTGVLLPFCDEDLLPAAVAIQSLLGQFAHPQVRADFIQQRFG